MKEDRIRVRRTASETQVTIGPSKRRDTTVFAALAVPLCLAGLVAPLNSLRSQSEVALGLILFLSFWSTGILAFCSLLILNVAWSRRGFWEVTISEDALRVTAKLGPFSRCWPYTLPHVRDIHIHYVRGKAGMVQRRIAFFHDGQMVFASPYVSAIEADSLLRGPFHRVAPN